jgi:Uma2 family endonuclease
MTMADIVLQPRGESWTFDDLDQTPDDGQRYEIFDGSLLVTPPPALPHTCVTLLLSDQLERQLPSGIRAVENVGIAIRGGTTVFVPDLTLLPLATLRRRAAVIAPDDTQLVIEVVSPSNAGRDLVLKRHGYAVGGIQYYWIVDPRAATVSVLELVGDAYKETATIKAGEAWHTEAPYPLMIEPAEFL